MARNFNDFITAYLAYAEDDFCPRNFHFWSGISVLSAAVERHCWLQATPSWTLHPNLYLFLVSRPGIGKSSAGNTATDLIRAALPDLHYINDQVTEAKLIQDMQAAEKVFSPPGQDDMRTSAGFLYVSEASNSLKDIHGSLLATFTDWYDCRTLWTKGTSTQGTYQINNMYFSMLVGTTFSYLKKLIPEDEVGGGFASRILYIVHDEVFERKPHFFESVDPAKEKERAEVRRGLIADLRSVNNCAGGFVVIPEYKKAMEEWYAITDIQTQNDPSERMQNFLTRRHTNVLKLSMILSLSQSSALVLEEHHFEKARAMIEGLYKKLPTIINISQAGSSTQSGMNQAIFAAFSKLEEGGSVPTGTMLQILILKYGFDALKAKQTLAALVDAKQLALVVGANGKNGYRLLGDPKNNL